MELGESGAKLRDICAVLRHEMLFLQGVYSYTAWRNSFFLHGFARLPMPAPAGLIGSPNPRSILARPTGLFLHVFARFWGCAPFDYTLQPVDFSLCLITGSGFSSTGSPSGPAQRVWGGGYLAHGGVGLGTGPPNRSGGVLDF